MRAMVMFMAVAVGWFLLDAAVIADDPGQARPRQAAPAKPPEKQIEPPNLLPLFDGAKRSPKVPDAGPLVMQPAPDDRTLFEMVASCWPAPSWFRPELSLDGNLTTNKTQGSTDNTSTASNIAGSYSSSTGGSQAAAQNRTYAGVNLRIPLYSAVEIDKEREREVGRREKIANAVGNLKGALAERDLTARRLTLTRALEARSRARVAEGIASTDEQVEHMKKVAELEGQAAETSAKLTRARFLLVGMCGDDKADMVDEYVMSFINYSRQPGTEGGQP